MRLAAYVLAADPAFLERSIASYYDVVDELVVSYDRSSRGWTGAPVDVAGTLERLRASDSRGKLRFCPGDYVKTHRTPNGCETAQRAAALAEAGRDADWVLQLDTDEVLPDPAALLAAIRRAEELGLTAVEWPMRVLFRSLGRNRFLEVCDADGSDRYEYPGPIAVRPGVRLVDARRTDGSFLRVVVRGDDRSTQLRRPAAEGEHRLELIDPEQAILHYSWAGSRDRIRTKVASWGHSDGLRSWAFYQLRWRPAPLIWRTMHDFHPFARGLWPALRVYEEPAR